MFCKGYTRAGKKNGVDMVIADLITKSEPETMPETTTGIENVQDGLAIAPGSTLITTSPFQVYMMNDEYEWDAI